MTTARKTMQLDILQLNSLNFLTSSNTAIPSSFVLTATGTSGLVQGQSKLQFDGSNLNVTGSVVVRSLPPRSTTTTFGVCCSVPILVS